MTYGQAFIDRATEQVTRFGKLLLKEYKVILPEVLVETVDEYQRKSVNPAEKNRSAIIRLALAEYLRDKSKDET